MRDDRLIMDVGMFDGSDTAFYLAIGFRVVAVEANQTLVERARLRFARELQDGSLTIVDKAIGPRAGRVQFHIHRFKEDWSSLHSDRWSGENAVFDAVNVECVTLDSVLRQFGVPYYLKIDIEGADDSAIDALSQFMDRPLYISAEAHTRIIIDQFHELGYRDFKLVDQAAKNQIKLPWPAREGRYTQAQFTDMHSGPFGEEIPGRWNTREEVLREYDDLVAQGRLTWHDFHASLPLSWFDRKGWQRAYRNLIS